MADVLTYMAKNSHADTFVSLFPKVGREGTVKNFLKNTALDGKLVLKSGSMNGVHCYAGYKIGTNGKPTHAVVVIVNNFSVRAMCCGKKFSVSFLPYLNKLS